MIAALHCASRKDAYVAIELPPQQKADEPEVREAIEPLGPPLTDVTASFAKPPASVGRAKQKPNGILADLQTRLTSLFRAAAPATDSAPVDVEKVDALEERAIEVLETLLPKTLGQAEHVFDAWFVELEQRASKKGPINALEYLTVLHVLKERLFEKSPELAPYVARMEKTLATMRSRLVGDKFDPAALTAKRFPRHYLAKQGRDVQAIHAAIFRPEGEGFISTVKGLAQNYIPRPVDAAIAATVLALCFSQVGVALLAGAVHGYLTGTFIEHAIHKHIGHASKPTLEKMERILSKFGPIGRSIHRSITETAFSHGTIHHASYAGDYVDRFAPRDKNMPPEELEKKRAERKQKIDAMVEARGPEAAKDIYDSDYGRSLANAMQDALTFLPVSALVTLATILVANPIGAGLGATFAAVSIAASLLFIPASKELHPFLHMPREEALAKAGPIMRRILKSRYASHVARAHYQHHRDATVNQNLVPGADYVLGYKASPLEAVLALRKMKTFY